MRYLCGVHQSTDCAFLSLAPNQNVRGLFCVNVQIEHIKSWTPRLCINITGTRIYTHIVRVFQCYQLAGIEAIETQIYFGFKRTYSIDCLGGPPIILPPIFLSHDKENSIAYQISIPKEKVLDSIYHDLPIPKVTDFIPKLN